MNTFALTVCDAAACRRFDAVRALVAADASGAFGILAHHRPLVAVLRYGLARFQQAEGNWQFMALAGGVLRFAGNEGSLVTVRCHVGPDRAALAGQLAEELAREDSELHAARATLEAIEQALKRRLAELGSRLHGAAP
jgi:F-type H+-transporting ATPase subunit epsilon